MERLSNKTAVVTGSGSGIGQAIAIEFAKQGAKLALVDLKEDFTKETLEKIKSNGGEAISYACDVSNSSQVKTTVNSIIQKFNYIDCLVNNAGVASIGNIEQTSEEEFDKIYRVNVKGVFLMTKEIISFMVQQNTGVILNMASIASKIGIPDRLAYSMSKGAVQTMTLSVARDYIDKNIRCNCICPARVHTPFVDNYLKDNYPGQEKEMFDKLSKTQPIGRMGKPEEMAHLAVYLCSDESQFVTGSSVDIDGGFINLK